MILATTKVEDYERFLAIFSTKGAEKRRQHGSKVLAAAGHRQALPDRNGNEGHRWSSSIPIARIAVTCPCCRTRVKKIRMSAGVSSPGWMMTSTSIVSVRRTGIPSSLWQHPEAQG
jgi:hypothetical protein